MGRPYTKESASVEICKEISNSRKFLMPSFMMALI
nr:MAG TPA: hypothetical protein [Caudoviricetes sp.]